VKLSIVKAWERFQKAELLMRSAALAYHTLLGVIPLVGLGFWYLHRIGVTDRWLIVTRDFVLDRLNVSSSEVFLEYFNRATQKAQGQGWSWIGLLILLYTGFGLLGKFGNSLDAVLIHSGEKAHSQKAASIVWGKRFVGMLGLPLALMISVVVSQWIREDSWLNKLIEVPHFGPLFALPIAWLTTIISVFFVYYFTPTVNVKMKTAFRVALVVGPCLEFLREALGVYSHYAVSVHKIYGIFAVVPLFILWIQLSWAILLGGAFWLLPDSVRPKKGT
jgi:membrane protein